MKLSRVIIDLGRPVAYYPELRHITTSTQATILICQLLYWTDKTRDADGWIYKTAKELEDETGLTYHEQKTAREKLEELGLLEVEYKRLDHTSRYRVMQEELNTQWETYSGKKSEERSNVQPSTSHNPSGTRRTDAKVKGDMVDMMLDLSRSKGMKSSNEKDVIRSKVSTRLRINPDTKRWNDFIDFLHNRETKHGEPVDKFLDWLINEKNYHDSSEFWSPDRMRENHPKAYYADTVVDDSFIIPMDEPKDDNSVPMPRNIGKRQN